MFETQAHLKWFVAKCTKEELSPRNQSIQVEKVPI